VYASRILLETVALSITLDAFTARHQREAKALLTSMRRAARTGDVGAWVAAHARDAERRSARVS
jgi:hypothetical protein